MLTTITTMHDGSLSHTIGRLQSVTEATLYILQQTMVFKFLTQTKSLILMCQLQRISKYNPQSNF